MIPRPTLPTTPPQSPRELAPDDAATPAGGLFGLGCAVDEALFVGVPAPYAATVSSRQGTVDGPRALWEASCQLDFADPRHGEPWRAGFSQVDEPVAMREMSARVGGLVARQRGGAGELAEEIDAAGREVWAWLDDVVSGLLEASRVPLVAGGEHAVSYGAIRAAARRAPLGVLQIDAHCDLRDAYEGLRTSHASVMRRVLEEHGVERLVQVGVRELAGEELATVRREGERVHLVTDAAIADDRLRGRPFAETVGEALAPLPERVWVSFDVDGLDPSLCPGTGTPVPGGLTWREAEFLIVALGESGRTIVGVDVVEIGPEYWDGYVAAKVAYALAGAALGGRRTAG